MVYCLQMVAAFKTAGRRDEARADIENRIALKVRWQPENQVIVSTDVSSASIGAIAGGTHGLRVDAVCFVLRIDAEDLLARVRSFCSGPRTPLAGSWVAIHDCPHDSGAFGACVVKPTERTGW